MDPPCWATHLRHLCQKRPSKSWEKMFEFTSCCTSAHLSQGFGAVNLTKASRLFQASHILTNRHLYGVTVLPLLVEAANVIRTNKAVNIGGLSNVPGQQLGLCFSQKEPLVTLFAWYIGNWFGRSRVKPTSHVLTTPKFRHHAVWKQMSHGTYLTYKSAYGKKNMPANALFFSPMRLQERFNWDSHEREHQCKHFEGEHIFCFGKRQRRIFFNSNSSRQNYKEAASPSASRPVQTLTGCHAPKAFLGSTCKAQSLLSKSINSKAQKWPNWTTWPVWLLLARSAHADTAPSSLHLWPKRKRSWKWIELIHLLVPLISSQKNGKEKTLAKRMFTSRKPLADFASFPEKIWPMNPLSSLRSRTRSTSADGQIGREFTSGPFHIPFYTSHKRKSFDMKSQVPALFSSRKSTSCRAPSSLILIHSNHKKKTHCDKAGMQSECRRMQLSGYSSLSWGIQLELWTSSAGSKPGLCVWSWIIWYNYDNIKAPEMIRWHHLTNH